MSELDQLIADLQQVCPGRTLVITRDEAYTWRVPAAALDIDTDDWVGSRWGDVIDDLLESSLDDTVAAYLAC